MPATRKAQKEPKEYHLADGVYYNVHKSAPLLLMNWQTLLKKARNGEITHIKKGALVLFKLEWLKDYLNEITTIGTATKCKH